MIDADVLRRIMPYAGDRAVLFAPLLEVARRRWVGDDRQHVAMWLAQLAHESGQLRYVREIASGEAYEGRASLGNTEPGDGPRFRGRGLIQLTGRDNYRRAGEALGMPLLEQPELLEQPAHAAAVSGWFWHWAKCGELMSAPDPVLAVTKRINGGTNGLDRRRAYYEVALEAVPAPIVESKPEPIVESKPRPKPVELPTRATAEIDRVELVASVWRALRAGAKLANSATWKQRQMAVTAVAALLGGAVGVAKSMGYDFQVDDETLLAIGGVVWFLVGLFDVGATAATTATVGLPPRHRDGQVERPGPGEPPGL